MTSKRLSIKRIIIMTIIALVGTTISMLAVLYLLTESVKIVLCGLFFAALIIAWIAVFIFLVRNKLTTFSSEICGNLDVMLNGKVELKQNYEEETLFTKINYRLTRLYEVMLENNLRVAEEKESIQEFISDISHQVKMPVANLKMINATLLEQNMPEEKRRDFLQAMDGQLDKLDFLMHALIKMSRLETGVIALVKKDCSIYETLAAVLGAILISAESKRIHISVDCPDNLSVSHDRKWTTEALFNIFDNAVKYTASGGSVHVIATQGEMYTKIEIIDTGKGILESRQTEIFKRFYREEEVHSIEGIGIGLYLAREIITLQGGYIMLISEPEKGSSFSVFLPNM